MSIVLAKSISVHTCEHGTVTIRLHDDDGRIFAAGQMDADTASTFTGQIIEQLQEFIEGAIGPDDTIGRCEGHG